MTGSRWAAEAEHDAARVVLMTRTWARLRLAGRPSAGSIDIGSLLSIHSFMPTPVRRKRSVSRDRKVPRTYRLPLAKLSAAKRALGAATATETIERALDLVVFQRELIDGTRSMQGIRITSPDPER